MELFVWWVILSLVVGWFSRSRGHSFLAGTFFALILSPVIAALILLIRKPNKAVMEKRTLGGGDVKKCPMCAEYVKSEAVKCKHCGADLSTAG